MKVVFRWLWGGVLALAGSSAQAQATYLLSVFPQYSIVELHRNWLPVLRRLSADSGIALELRVAPSISRFESDFLKGGPDLVYLNPYHVVMARRAHGYAPLLRDRAGLSGVLLVHKDSGLRAVQDLNDQTIVFPSPNSFGASLYLRALLTEQFGLRFTPRYLGNHSNAIRHVARRAAEAGGALNGNLQAESPQVREQLTILFRTPETASHALAAHPRVPEPVRQAVSRAFLSMANDEAGRALLRAIDTPDPVPADFARDYQPLERLGLEKYLVIDKD
jgi:phosphonate transport system substrate-binding protein